MHFLVEHQTEDRAQFTLCDTLSDVHLIACEVMGEELQLERLGAAPEAELAGEWGIFRYAPAA